MPIAAKAIASRRTASGLLRAELMSQRTMGSSYTMKPIGGTELLSPT
jgi:hypothetical protein